MNISEENQLPDFTWEQLKDFCNSLSDEQLSQNVRVIQEEGSLEIDSASEIGDDHYKFDDEEHSVTKSDFDPEYDLDGRYKTLEEAIEKEDYVLTPKTNVYLFERF
jgi:hypothetical protein